MHVTETAAVQASAETPAGPSFEDTVLSLLTEMSQRLSVQEERLTAIESQPAQPTFLDPKVHANTAAAERSRQALAATPDGIPRGQTIPVFPTGEKVPEMVMRHYRPKFNSGDLVQLNLDAVPHGRSDGRTRGELMVEKGVPNGYGEILDRTYLSVHDGVGWKYRVKFDKRVMPGSNGGIVYLHEQEMLPA